MRSITLRNYRCFGDVPQTARLAPLTLLVGENSSGKTSLMAMVRALWDIAYSDRAPDFKQEPYGLGSFEEIAHHRGAGGGRAQAFEAGFEDNARTDSRNDREPELLGVKVTFEEQWSAPAPVSRRLERGGYWLVQHLREGELDNFEFGTPRGRWRCHAQSAKPTSTGTAALEALPPIRSLLFRLRFAFREEEPDLAAARPLKGAPDLTIQDVEELDKALLLSVHRFGGRRDVRSDRPFASAPVRSQPKRTYDPVRVSVDPVGDYVPTYLAQLALRDASSWDALQERLEAFGRDAGLFDELRVRRRGKTDVDPFQVQVRKFGKGVKGSVQEPRRRGLWHQSGAASSD